MTKLFVNRVNKTPILLKKLNKSLFLSDHRSAIFGLMIVAWLILPAQVVAQDFFCGTSVDEMENYEKAIFQPQAIASCSVTTTKGYHIPSIDTMRIRVIFAKFQDDNDNVSYWPQAGFPSSALSFIDSTASQNSTHKLNLTNYYRTFSDGQYILIGKVDTVTLNQSMLNSLYMGTSGTYETKTYNANKAILKSLSGRPGLNFMMTGLELTIIIRNALTLHHRLI